VAAHDSNTIIKFAEDTTVIGLIADDDEPIGRRSETWQCGSRANNLCLNVSNTKELIVDHRKQRSPRTPPPGLYWSRSKLLGVHITKELTWSTHTHTVVKRAQQLLFPLRKMIRSSKMYAAASQRAS
jgi:hypothetical protein